MQMYISNDITNVELSLELVKPLEGNKKDYNTLKIISKLDKDFDNIAKNGEGKCIFFDGRNDQPNK